MDEWMHEKMVVDDAYDAAPMLACDLEHIVGAVAVDAHGELRVLRAMRQWTKPTTMMVTMMAMVMKAYDGDDEGARR